MDTGANVVLINDHNMSKETDIKTLVNWNIITIYNTVYHDHQSWTEIVKFTHGSRNVLDDFYFLKLILIHTIYRPYFLMSSQSM